MISAMGSGLDFGRLLKLSPEVAFGSLQISQFLALPTFVRPFKHIRCEMMYGTFSYIILILRIGRLYND